MAGFAKTMRSTNSARGFVGALGPKPFDGAGIDHGFLLLSEEEGLAGMPLPSLEETMESGCRRTMSFPGDAISWGAELFAETS